MNKLYSILCAAVTGFCTVVLASCGGGSGTGDFNNAGGKPYEVILSVEQELWNGEVGDTLRSVLLEPVPMLNQVEPMFDVSRVNPGALKDIVLRHRNILIVGINPDLKEPESVARYDVYARPQIIVNITAPDNGSLVRYLTDNRKELQQLFEITERDRAVANNRKYGEKGIDAEVRKMFDVGVNIPRGFSIRSRSGSDFMWIGNDVRTAIQGFVIYSYPYSGSSDFSKDKLIERRNEFMARIPGPSEGSFMATENEYVQPEVAYVKINGRPWARMSGFWYVENDFMGGPFINYSTVDEKSGKVISMDCFVYSPKDPKRNMLHQLEHIVYTADFAPVQSATKK